MATVNFEYRSTKDKASLSLRFRHYTTTIGNTQVEIKTNKRVSREEWNKNDLDKNLKRDLEDIEDYILNAFNTKHNKEFIVTKDWLQSKYDEFHGRDQKPIKTLLVEWLQNEIDELTAEEMSKSRIKGMTTYKNIINQYNQFLEIPDLSSAEFLKLKRWLLDKKYALSTIEKLLDDIRTVCRRARVEGVQLANDFDTFKVRTRKSKSRDSKKKTIISLTIKEIESIEGLDLKQDYLINTRKWLILGCYTAQRGGDLLNRIIKENFVQNKKGIMIEFTQEKTGERMEIKALPKVSEMYLEDELPHKIAIQNLNKYVKILCKKAEINTRIKANLREKITLDNGKEVFRNVEKLRPKYKYISSHDFRRTFCTMHFRTISNEEIMKFSGHRTTREFLNYVGAKDNDYSAWDKMYEK